MRNTVTRSDHVAYAMRTADLLRSEGFRVEWSEADEPSEEERRYQSELRYWQAEETGYHAGRWRRLAEFYPSPGILSERMFLFLAEDLTPGPVHPEPGEELEPLVVPWKEAVGWALDGTIRDAKTLVGLLLWDRLRGNA